MSGGVDIVAVVSIALPHLPQYIPKNRPMSSGGFICLSVRLFTEAGKSLKRESLLNGGRAKSRLC